jgi:hypothetical protein
VWNRHLRMPPSVSYAEQACPASTLAQISQGRLLADFVAKVG